MSTTMPETKRWTRREYHDAASAGVFRDERVELVCGEILVMSPMDARHATGIQLIQIALQKLAMTGIVVRGQLPLALGIDSEPEPDLAVVTGNPRDFANEHPTTALLVVEVSASTLTFDRTTKRHLYAQHSIPEYWIANLQDRRLEVYRDPRNGDYTDTSWLTAGQAVVPLAFPDHSIPVADLLP